MCRTGRVFRPEVAGRKLEFRLVGAIFRNAILEDRGTGSWWWQASGRAAVGPMTDALLPPIPSEQMSLGAWLALHPTSDVMAPDPASEAGYHIYSFDSYDGRRPDPNSASTRPGQEREWVVWVRSGEATRAYPWDLLERQGLVVDQIGGEVVLVLLMPDNLSFRAFRGRLEGVSLAPELAPAGDGMVDVASGTRFGFDGVGSGGAYAGCVLDRLEAYQELWHSYQRFTPGGTRFESPTANAR